MKTRVLQHFRDAYVVEITRENLVDATEFSQLPLWHNEDTKLPKQCPLKVNVYTMDSPNRKVRLHYLKSHRLALPCPDYLTDTESIMDNGT